MVRELSLGVPDRGFLLLNLFSEYFKENEKKWLKLFFELGEVISYLKKDREFLMAKYEQD